MLVGLDQLSKDARERLAQITLPAAREHASEWLSDLDAARTEIAEALAPGNGGVSSECRTSESAAACAC
ncbi:MAG TPA: hypothetical protein VF469_28055 [Kofleriaceae bacterium]